MALSIHQATIEDVAAIAAIHVAGWRGAYDGILDPSYIESKTIDHRLNQWKEIFEKNESDIWIAKDEDKAVGFIGYGRLKTAPPGTSKIRPQYSSEIYALYLLPDFYRQGIGTGLFRQAAVNLKTQKHTSLCLWVLDRNKRGCHFYEALGGQRIAKKIVEFGPTQAKEVCYGWRDISVLQTCEAKSDLL